MPRVFALIPIILIIISRLRIKTNPMMWRKKKRKKRTLTVDILNSSLYALLKPWQLLPSFGSPQAELYLYWMMGFRNICLCVWIGLNWFIIESNVSFTFYFGDGVANLLTMASIVSMISNLTRPKCPKVAKYRFSRFCLVM